MNESNSRFEQLLFIAKDSGLSLPIVRVSDVAEVSRAWLEEKCPDNYTATDVLTMTAMIINEVER